MMNPELMHQALYAKAVLDYVYSEYETDWDNGLFQITPEMADYLKECHSTLMCYPNAAGKFVELFINTIQNN